MDKYEELKKVKNEEQFTNYLYDTYTPSNEHDEVQVINVHENVFYRMFFILSKHYPYRWTCANYVMEIEHQYGTLILINKQEK